MFHRCPSNNLSGLMSQEVAQVPLKPGELEAGTPSSAHGPPSTRKQPQWRYQAGKAPPQTARNFGDVH